MSDPRDAKSMSRLELLLRGHLPPVTDGTGTGRPVGPQVAWPVREYQQTGTSSPDS